MSAKPNDDGRKTEELRALRAERAASLKSDHADRRLEVALLDALIAARMKDLPSPKEEEALVKWRMARKRSSTSTLSTTYARPRRSR